MRASWTCSRRSRSLARSGSKRRWMRSGTGSAKRRCSARACSGAREGGGIESRLVIQAIPMNPRKTPRDISVRGGQDVFMASEREEAAGAAWQGADIERPISGENPESESLEEARRWVRAYGHLVTLEQALFDLLAKMIPGMPGDAQREAE